MAANNHHLTSFSVGLRRRSFVQNVCAGIKNLHTTCLQSAGRNEYKYQLNPQKWRARIQWKNLDEIRVEMGKKWEKNCETKYGVVEKNPKSKWRHRLLQSQRCNKSRSSEVGHEQYWIFITHVSNLTILRI